MVSLKPPDELVVCPLRRSVLFIGFLGRYLEASGWPFIAVPVTGVAAREKFSTVPAEVDLGRVRLAAYAVQMGRSR